MNDGARIISKAGRLLLLKMLRDLGVLETMTLQNVADIFQYERSTALRDIRVLNRVAAEYERLLRERPWDRLRNLRRDGWLPLREAARRTGYSGDHLALLARGEKIGAQKIRGRWWIESGSVERYQEQRLPGAGGRRGPQRGG